MVPAHVVDHVAQCIASFFDRRERPRVGAVDKQATVTSHAPIEPSRKSNAEPLHASRKRASITRFDDEVKVIRLNRKVHDSQTKAMPCVVQRIENHVAVYATA
jgi:hypothetical protein